MSPLHTSTAIPDLKTALIHSGRPYKAYLDMFALEEKDLAQRILDCPGGFSNFNAVATRLGKQVVSVDPIYALPLSRLKKLAEDGERVLADTAPRKNWFGEVSPQRIAIVTESLRVAKEEFFSDFPKGLAAQRYLAASLPDLPFADNSFDLALSGYFLFLYEASLSFEFHLQSLQELLRVATEVRVFPLVRMDDKPSAFLEPLKSHFCEKGYAWNSLPTRRPFRKGGATLLSIKRPVILS